MNRIFLVLLVATTSLYARSIKPFELPLMNSSGVETFNSANHPNAVFVLEAFFDDCPYCHQNAPNVHQLAEEFAETNTVVLDLGVDTERSEYESWIESTKPNHPVLMDANRTVIRQLGTSGYPSTYVVDCKGTVRLATKSVWSTSTKAKLRSTIKAVLAENCQP